MSFFQALLNITPYPRLSILVWIMILLLALYLARHPFNRLIRAVVTGVSSALQQAASAILSLEKRLSKRNREVLLTAGLEKSNHLIEREFERYNAADLNNLAGYTTIHRQMSEMITRLEDDHVQSADVAPSLPNWIPIIETVAKIEHTGDTMVSNMLCEINRTLKEQHRTSLENYRNTSVKRHAILNKMLPLWRELHKKLNSLGDLAASVNERVIRIERNLDAYEQIRSQADKTSRTLFISASTQFCTSTLLLVIAAVGAVLNFHLIRLPMMEIVGGAHHIGTLTMGDAAGLVLTVVQLSLGIFIFESLQLTRMFPVIRGMEDGKRRRLFWTLLAILVVFAGIESCLAILRDRMISDSTALQQMLSGVENGNSASGSGISTLGHALLGFLLPFWVALAAVPLESFMTSARTVLGAFLAGNLRFAAFLMQWIGALTEYIGNFLCTAYDLIIFPTLWLEGIFSGVPAHIRIPAKPSIPRGFATNSPGTDTTGLPDEHRKENGDDQNR